MEYLETTFEDPAIREMLQMMFGYILSGSTHLNVGFFLIGKGGDGKSVAAHILRKLIGESNTCCLPFSEMGSKFTSYMLSQNLLNLVEELPVNSELRAIADCEKTYKMVTDGAIIPTERKNVDPGCAKATARCVFLANGMPNFTDKSDGLWDRIVLIPFDHRFRDSDEEKPNLKYDLEEELPGILNWAIAGGQKLQNVKRFPIPYSVQARMKQHRRLCNHEEDFFEERLILDPESYVPKSVLYSVYSNWMQESGYKPLGKSKFNTLLQDYYKDAIREDRIRHPQDILIWRGINFN